MRLDGWLDRERDTYREVVTDPETGELIHHCEEPLSEHLRARCGNAPRRAGGRT